MKQISKYLFIAILLNLILLISGCKTIDNNANEKIKIDEIKWELKEGIIGGDRYALFSFINNTSYTIYEINIELTPKKNINDSKYDEFFSFFQSEYGMSVEEIEHLKEVGFLRIECDFTVEWSDKEPIAPREKLENEKICYYGYIFVTNLNYLNMFEENIMTIKYLEEGNLYTVYYDYKNNTYTHDTEYESLEDYLQ